MNKQHGLATLSVVSGIVAIGALFSFAVMQLGVNETKKIQNLIIKANETAHVRAALDCAVAVFEIKDLDPRISLPISEFNECKVTPETVFTLTGTADEGITSHWTLTATYGFARASVVIASGSAFASFKTSGSVEITGGNDWESATGDVVTIDGKEYVECTVIVAGGSVTIDVENTGAEFKTHAASDTNLECSPNHSTVIKAGSGAVKDDFEQDILTYQSNLNIFRDFFGVPKSQWETIKAKFEANITTGSAISNPEAVTNCGKKIKEAITAGNELIWVDGDCMLNELTNTGAADQSPLIVIKNGIVGVNGGLANFKGTIFQFTIDYPNQNLANSWGPQSNGVCAAGAMNPLCGQLINLWGHDLDKWATLPFYIYGSFSTDGGYLIDIPNTTALIEGGFQMSYDDGLEGNPITDTPPKVLKGSYHDF